MKAATARGFKVCKSYYRVLAYQPVADTLVCETPDGHTKQYTREQVLAAKLIARITGRNVLQEGS
jgi:hypothetical protein